MILLILSAYTVNLERRMLDTVLHEGDKVMFLSNKLDSVLLLFINWDCSVGVAVGYVLYK
jgi:hypothetical protein